MQDRKTRADNFSEEDKGLLLSLIADHVNILECRKTDHKNNSAKYKAWAAISRKFHQRASHPRNFTQMKDLYRRLKLKAKKDVGTWLKECVKAGTSAPRPGSNVFEPDDTSFLVYDMIKPFKEDLNPEDEEQERILAEALKSRELTEASFLKLDDGAISDDATADKRGFGNGEASDEEEEGEEASVKIKEEPDYEYVPPDMVDSVSEGRSSPAEPPNKRRRRRTTSDLGGKQRGNHREEYGARSVGRRPGRPAKNAWEPDPGQPQPQHRRRSVQPSVEGRRAVPAPFSSTYARPRRTWPDGGGGSTGGSFSRDPAAASEGDGEGPDGATEGMSPYEEAMFRLAQAEHKAKMLVMQTQRRAETAKEEAYKVIWQNAQLQRDLLQMQYENVV